MKTKLQYQVNRGWEMVTLAEASKWWMYTHLRADAHLFVGACACLVIALYSRKMTAGHIDPVQGVLLKNEMLSMTEISSLFDYRQNLKVFTKIMNMIRGLEEGQYLLSHAPSKRGTVVLHRAVSDVGT